MFSYQQFHILNEALESGSLDSSDSIEKVIEDLMKYVNLSKDKGDISSIRKAVQAFKVDRINSLINRSLSGSRNMPANKQTQLSQWISGMIAVEAFTFAELSNFFRRLQKRDFFKDLNFTPGKFHPIEDLIPNDPVIQRIWKRAYSFTVREGLISGGRGEMLLTILGGGEVGTGKNQGGDVLFPGNNGIEIKTMSSSFIPRDKQIKGDMWKTFPQGGVWLKTAGKYLSIEDFKQQVKLGRKKDYPFFSAVGEIMHKNGATKDFIAGVFGEWMDKAYGSHVSNMKSHFLTNMNTNGTLKNEQKFQEDMLIMLVEMYKNISQWKYLMVFDGESSNPTGYYIIEKPSDALLGVNKTKFKLGMPPFTFAIK